MRSSEPATPLESGASPLVLDRGWRTTRDAEHATGVLLTALDLTPESSCTHFVDGRVVVTVEFAGEAGGGGLSAVVAALGEQLDDGVAACARHHAARTSGRAFAFPGGWQLTGTVTVSDVLARTGIDTVLGIGGTPVEGSALLRTQDFVRPAYADGRLVLRVRPAEGGCFVPFEQPNPTPCCAHHA